MAKRTVKKSSKVKQNTKPETEKGNQRSPRWTFLTNHAHVLAILAGDPQLVLRVVAARVGITERAVQRIVLDLEDEGYIERERVGRQNHYRVIKQLALRHPIEAHRNIGDLLKLISITPKQ
ncbi:MAG TPA: winged helix-turn-helix transcriptional regulator [Phycisphaerae bacterium]|nr:winged helix-turn-helix transcriptional regulator [Phycisphaerales bacterium]HNO79063.1 winged helix-turn-helix transcriptional regulator [Phycisphaerae bacterium]